MGSRGKALLLLSLVVLKAVSFIMADNSKGWMHGINAWSVEVVQHAASLCIALSVSLILDGEWAVEKITSWHPFWRFLGVSILFSIATWFTNIAYKQDLAHAAVELVGYSYMPTAAALAYFIFRRRYGILEWLSMGMMTLAACTFMLLRERYVAGGDEFAVGLIRQHIKTLGVILVLCSVIASALASTLAEGIYKEQWQDLKTKWSLGHDRFYIMKVYIECSALMIALIGWVMPKGALAQAFGLEHYTEWWGPWGWFEVVQVCIDVALSWVAGLVTQQMNTVVKAIGQTIAGILAVMLGDPIINDRYRFHLRAAPEGMLAIIVLMSAIIFQTGRIIIERLHGQMDSGPKGSRAQDSNDDEDGPNGLFSTAPQQGSPVSGAAMPQETSTDNMTNYDRVANYACIVLYIFVDCGRTLLNKEALSSSAINPTTMSLLVFVCGALLATCLTIWLDGCAGLRATWRCAKVLQCLPAACLFAVGQCLTSFAFAFDIPAALANVLGKIYTPIAAFGGRCILDRYYSWLEYFAIIILTLASLTFGYLQEYNVATGLKLANMSAMLCAVGSALFSAFGSLAMEKILQGVKRGSDEEPEQPEAYHIQKTRLDFGSALASLALLPIISIISRRPKDNIWVSRPLGTNCTMCTPVLSNATFHMPWETLSNVCSPQTCVGECSCFPSIFVGWNNYLLIAALVVNVAQGWLIGKITKQFSTIHRAIADAFSTLLLYWVGEPGLSMLVNGTSYMSCVKDLCLDMTSFIVPLSTVTFMVATHQMKKVMENAAKSPTGVRLMALEDSSSSDTSEGSDRHRADEESDTSSSVSER